MSVGYTTTKASIDQQSGALAQQLAVWARSATNLGAYLAAASEADLVALGYDAVADVPLLKSAGADMAKLAAIYYGETNQDPAYDFRTFTLRIAGLQL